MIRVEKDGALWRLVIERPDKANSLTEAMLQKLIDAVDAARNGPKVVVFTGAGTVFSAGADLNEVATGLATCDLWEQLSGAIAALPSLTIAALNGTVAGGAFGMVLACDLRVAVDDATMFYPVMNLGFLPQPSDAHRLSVLIGPARAKMILMAGQKITAAEAQQWGLVDSVVQRENLNTTVLELAADALGADVAHVASIKKMIP